MGYLLSIGYQVKEKVGDKQTDLREHMDLSCNSHKDRVLSVTHLGCGEGPPRAYSSKGLKRHNRVQTSFQDDLRTVHQLRGEGRVYVGLLYS